MKVTVTLETTFEQSLQAAKVAHIQCKIRRKQHQLKVLEERCERVQTGYAEGEGMKFPSCSVYEGGASASSSDAE